MKNTLIAIAKFKLLFFDIDTWPGIPTYMELEGKDEEDLNSILNLLGYSMKDCIMHS